MDGQVPIVCAAPQAGRGRGSGGEGKRRPPALTLCYKKCRALSHPELGRQLGRQPRNSFQVLDVEHDGVHRHVVVLRRAGQGRGRPRK